MYQPLVIFILKQNKPKVIVRNLIKTFFMFVIVHLLVIFGTELEEESESDKNNEYL